MLVGRQTPWRELIGDLRLLADQLEFNELPGPADLAAIFGDDLDELRRAG